MANDTYAVASGADLYAGWPVPSQNPPAWAASIPENTFTAIPGGQSFTAWAASGIPFTDASYNGNSPKRAIVDAYCDPALGDGVQFFYGGGHGDGSCNAVVKWDIRNLAFTLVGQPTNPATYPPSYANGDSAQPGPLVYPSGLDGVGWFLPAPPLTDPADLPYANALARASSHMYAAAVLRGSVVHYFYGEYAEFDTATGQWLEASRGVDLGAQLLGFRTQYGSVQLQQGTAAVYDPVTDRFFVTLNPGDAGGGWRNGLIVFNPNTSQIVSSLELGSSGPLRNSVNLCVVGRKIYVFLKDGPSNTSMNYGVICDMDAMAAVAQGTLALVPGLQNFVLVGATAASTYSGATNQETIPSWWDPSASRIRRWNYDETHGAKVLSVNPTPVGGAGTLASPWQLTQSEIPIAGTKPPLNKLYKRAQYHAPSGCVVFLPQGDTAPYALKVTGG